MILIRLRMKCIMPLLFFILLWNSSEAQIGKSLVLNGCTDFLEIEESDLLDYDDVLSIECWIAPNCVEGNRILIGKEWCVGEFSYYFSVLDERLNWRFSQFGFCNSNISSIQSIDKVIPSNEFTHVAVVHDEFEVKFFVNGSQVMTQYVEGSFHSIYNSNQEFRIGAYKYVSGSFGNYYSGLIDELRVWNIPLTESMIQMNMNNTLSGNENGLILYQNMESIESGPGITLPNQANIFENLIATPGGYTDGTPYFIESSDYFTNPLNFKDQYYVCDDVLNITVGDNIYKSVQWSNGSQNNGTTILNSGIYSVTIETELCKFFSQSIEVFILENIIEEENIYLCPGDSYEYQGQFLTPNSSTEFVLPGMFGCDTSITINVFEIPEEEASFLGMDINSCIDTVTLTSPYENTIWNDDFVGAELTVLEEGTYIAVATDEQGCIF